MTRAHIIPIMTPDMHVVGGCAYYASMQWTALSGVYAAALSATTVLVEVPCSK